MRFTLQREAFLKPLAQVVNVVERRQTLSGSWPISWSRCRTASCR